MLMMCICSWDLTSWKGKLLLMRLCSNSRPGRQRAWHDYWLFCGPDKKRAAKGTSPVNNVFSRTSSEKVKRPLLVFFGTFSRSTFLVKKRNQFFPKCHNLNFELWVCVCDYVRHHFEDDCGGYMGRLRRLYGKIVEVIWEDCGGYMCSTIARLPFLGRTLCSRAQWGVCWNVNLKIEELAYMFFNVKLNLKLGLFSSTFWLHICKCMYCTFAVHIVIDHQLTCAKCCQKCWKYRRIWCKPPSPQHITSKLKRIPTEVS